MPNQPKTPQRKVRMDDMWDELGVAAAQVGKDRSVLIRELVAWWLRAPGAKLPPRLPS